MSKSTLHKPFLLLYLLGGVALLIVLVCLLCSSDDDHDPYTEIGTFCGEPLYAGEFQIFLQKHQDQVYIELSDRNKLSGSAVWTKEYEDQTGYELLWEYVMEEYLRHKAEQLLMRADGLLEDAGYPSFYMTWQEENQNRAAKIKNQEVVYGPDQYAENTFYFYLHAVRRAVWEDCMAGRGAEIPEDQLLTFYDSEKFSRYLSEGDVTVRICCITYRDETGTLLMERQEAEKLLAESLEAENAVLPVRQKTETISAASLDRVEFADPFSLARLALSLEVGETSEIMVDTGYELQSVYCLERGAAAPLPYEAVKSQVRLDYETKLRETRIQDCLEEGELLILDLCRDEAWMKKQMAAVQ